MTRRLEALQWFGLFGGAAAWTAQFVLGYGLAQEACSPGGSRLGVGTTVPQLALTVGATVIVVLAALAALAVVVITGGTHYDGPPPDGRRRFFALGALAANLLFLAIVLNTGLQSVHHFPCRQS
jgi:hypothetical protein